jgi:DNA-binding transcriptional LysR family regulator
MHRVRYFLALCETPNFARAAETCNFSQPALTRAVRKLEEELGGLLLRREHLLTHLTDFGRLGRPHLDQMMAQAEAAKSTTMHLLQMDKAPINLGVMRTVGPIRFMSFLAEFRASHPGCEVTLTEGVPGHLAELLLDGKFDPAVMAQPEPFTDRIEIRPLYRERFCVAFPDGSSLRGEEPGQHHRCRRVDLSWANQLRIRGPPERALSRTRVRAPGRLPQRAGGLDPDDGRRWVWDLLYTGVLADNPRPSHSGGCRPGSCPPGLPGVDRGPALLAGGRRLRSPNPGVQVAGDGGEGSPSC